MSAVHHRPAGERRSRAVLLARLAESQVANGQLEQACQTWHRFVDDYPSLRSRRVRSALAELRARTRPHQNNPAVRALRQRVAETNARHYSAGSP